MYTLDQELKVVETKPLGKNEVAPPLKMGQIVKVKEIYVCGCGLEHYHVELYSEYNYINCFNCKKPIPQGDSKHWCHPSRFAEIVAE